MGEMPPAARRPGRPRSEQVTAAILRAAGDLLAEEGLLAMTLDAVAARAGTSRATIYRWWDSKEALALDVVASRFEEQVALVSTDTGSLLADLRAHLDIRVRALSTPGALRAWAAMLAQTHADAAFGDAYRARVYARMRETMVGSFARAIVRGEIPADTDVELALDLLLGAVGNRLLLGNTAADSAFVSGVVGIVVKGLIVGDTSDA